MSEPFLGEIRMVGFNFAPVGWFQCNGQLLPISQYAALFALLGTTYGGNGTSTFALPNLQSRVAVHQGQGPGLSPYVMGEVTGSESVTLLSTQMPQHTHLVNVVTNSAGDSSAPGGNLLSAVPIPRGQTASTPLYNSSASPDATLKATAISTAGGSQPFSVLQPILVVNFIIAFTGIFPSRN